VSKKTRNIIIYAIIMVVSSAAWIYLFNIAQVADGMTGVFFGSIIAWSSYSLIKNIRATSGSDGNESKPTRISFRRPNKETLICGALGASIFVGCYIFLKTLQRPLHLENLEYFDFEGILDYTKGLLDYISGYLPLGLAGAVIGALASIARQTIKRDK
jgi:hypothetical protein